MSSSLFATRAPIDLLLCDGRLNQIVHAMKPAAWASLFADSNLGIATSFPLQPRFADPVTYGSSLRSVRGRDPENFERSVRLIERPEREYER